MHRVDAIDPVALQAALQARRGLAPLRAKIKLIWACNLKCPFCSQWRALGQPPPRQGALDEATLARLLADLAALGCTRVHFSGGEPLLKPDLARWVREAKALGMSVSMTSNGTLWHPERAAELVEAGVDVVTFSIDAPVAAVHDRFRGEGMWAQAAAGIRAARRAAKASGRRVVLRANTVVSRLNHRLLPEWPALAHAWGIRRLSLLPIHERHDHGEAPLALGLPELQEWDRTLGPAFARQAFALGLIGHEDQAYPWGRSEEAWREALAGRYARGQYREGQCYAPQTHTVVAADGLVYACCTMKSERRPVGDLKEASFAELWEGPGYRAFREAMAKERFAACHGCDDFLPENAHLDARLQALAAPLK